jgi:PAS domain-containing protein
MRWPRWPRRSRPRRPPPSEAHRQPDLSSRVPYVRRARRTYALAHIVAAGNTPVWKPSEYAPISNVIGWNHAAEEQSGFPAAEVLGRPADDFMQPFGDGHPPERFITADPRHGWTETRTLRHHDGGAVSRCCMCAHTGLLSRSDFWWA